MTTYIVLLDFRILNWHHCQSHGSNQCGKTLTRMKHKIILLDKHFYYKEANRFANLNHANMNNLLVKMFLFFLFTMLIKTVDEV